ncbi:phosphoribosylanthranilate isomerase [bacterium]|nr:phosphoribosylanthranilate isomerase [bacterium]
MMKIKICGITNRDDAMDAVNLGVDAVGFIFYEDSPRYISPDIVEEISLFLPPFVLLVGVFVNHDKPYIDAVTHRCRLDLIQLHGNESPAFCRSMRRRVIKAFKIADIQDVDQIAAYQSSVSAVLLDTKVSGMEGGTGKVFDWGLAIKAKEFDIPLVLAGGINAQNLNKAVKLVNPYGVDLSSSVESLPGKKDYNKMQELVVAARSV